jgi:hypothetical protein
MRSSLEAIKYKDAKTLVDIIHKTLYSYSNSNLHFLLQNSPAFRFILDHAIKNKRDIFSVYKKNNNMGSAGSDS